MLAHVLHHFRPGKVGIGPVDKPLQWAVRCLDQCAVPLLAVGFPRHLSNRLCPTIDAGVKDGRCFKPLLDGRFGVPLLENRSGTGIGKQQLRQRDRLYLGHRFTAFEKVKKHRASLYVYCPSLSLPLATRPAFQIGLDPFGPVPCSQRTLHPAG